MVTDLTQVPPLVVTVHHLLLPPQPPVDTVLNSNPQDMVLNNSHLDTVPNSNHQAMVPNNRRVTVLNSKLAVTDKRLPHNNQADTVLQLVATELVVNKQALEVTANSKLAETHTVEPAVPSQAVTVVLLPSNKALAVTAVLRSQVTELVLVPLLAVTVLETRLLHRVTEPATVPQPVDTEVLPQATARTIHQSSQSS